MSNETICQDAWNALNLRLDELRETLCRGQRLGYGQEAERGEYTTRETVDDTGKKQIISEFACGLTQMRQPDRGESQLTYAWQGKCGRWEYQDTWYGGEPYAGMTTVSLNGRVVFAMTYFGSVSDGVKDCEPIYDCLRAALAQVDHQRPWRGPAACQHDDYYYIHQWSGDVVRFHGHEWILASAYPDDPMQSHPQVYDMHYSGGLVNMRRQEEAD